MEYNMKYINRELERKFLKMNKCFKVLMVTGARQTGKSTMLQHLAEKSKRTYVNLDNYKDRNMAETDPDLFFQMYKPPILIDEVQKAPRLFEKIKEICDASDDMGQFWLTGSESTRLIKQSQESLAGRICLLRMYSLSQREKQNAIGLKPLSFNLSALKEREEIFQKNNIVKTFEDIWCGGMPATREMDYEQMQEYYSSYIDTYLIRDAVEDNGVTDIVAFRKVLQAATSFMGNLVNYSDLAEAGGVSVPTVKKWINILQNMGIVYLLQPYSNNALKRLVKTPKLYFCDTGLAASLSMWTNPEVLMHGAASGHFYENYVVGEIIRNYAYSENKANICFYRDTNQKEIDIIIEENGLIHPIEVKKSASPDTRAVKSFNLLSKSSHKLSTGGIICMADKVFPIDSNNNLIPSNII